MPLVQQISTKTNWFLVQWLIFGMVALILGGSIGYSITRDYNNIETVERDRLATQSKVIDANLGNQLNAAYLALVGIRGNLPFWKARKDGMALASQSLRTMGNVMPGLRTFLILDFEGIVVAASRDELIGRNFSERDYFRTPRRHPDPAMFYISPPFTTVLGVFGMNVVCVIPGPNGQFAGIVAATINPDYLTVLLGSVLYTNDMWIVLAHGDGRQFLRVPERRGTQGMDLAQPGSFFTRHRESGRTITMLTGIAYPAGEECLVSQRTIKLAKVPMDKPLVVAVGRELTAIYATWRRDAFMECGLFGLLALTTAFGLLFYQRRQREHDRHAAGYAAKLSETVSELQSAEKVSRESEERFRSIVDTASDGILIARMSTRKFVEANIAICEMLGYTREELLRIGVENIHPAPDLPHVIAEFNRQSRGEKRISESLPVMRKDGSVFYADISANPIEFGGEQYQVGIFRDTTERKLAENALRESEERYHELFENANDVIYTHDLAGNFTSINKAAEQVTGYTLDEALKINIFSVLAPGSADVVRRMISRKVTGGGQTRYELEIVCKNGCRVPLEVSTRIIYRSGEPVGVQGIARDITERRQAEEEKRKLEQQLQQAMKMEAVGRLAGGVAHDFNNLLTVINGYSELLIQRLGENSPMRKDVEEILHAGNQAGALTRQLLVFSRKQVLQPKVIDLNMVVSKTGKMLRRLIGENIKFRTILAEGLGRVNADEGQAEQILLNLAINARDAMPGGGELTIETANVVLDETFTKDHPSLIPGPHVLLSVGDTGSGIPDEVRRHIFEPFFTTKEQGKGTGLGLATVYGIVQQSQGHLDFYTEAGKGTTFRIYLPRVEEDNEALPTVPVEAPPGSETVLVVEDETSVREIVDRVLSAKGYRVLTASDGSEGLRMAGEYNGPIDLLLTDLVMPGMGGRQLATRLAAGRPGVKVLFMSGYTEDAISHEGVLEAGLSFIQKPFTSDALLRKVREILDGK
ncbi:MAG: PAS domain S-box protein [bacterium]|nr:PAS domain S-box protein [bacterium]